MTQSETLSQQTKTHGDGGMSQWLESFQKNDYVSHFHGTEKAREDCTRLTVLCGVGNSTHNTQVHEGSRKFTGKPIEDDLFDLNNCD